MEEILSIALYVFFFLGGVWVDKSKNKWLRRVFVLASYIFMCFGYMTGSDWRSYELDYGVQDLGDIRVLYEPGYIFLITKLSNIIPDFWLALGLLKCLYFYTVISVFKKISTHWIACISLAMPVFTMFMIIENPLRFMIAMTVINIGLLMVLRGKKVLGVLFFLSAFLFHYTSVVSLPVFLFYFARDKICAITAKPLIIVFFMTSIIMGSAGTVASLWGEANTILQLMGTKSYETYTVTSNSSFFTIGSLIDFILGAFLIYSKERILRADKEYGRIIYTFSIAYIFMYRILLIVPTGFRLVIPIATFYVAAWVLLIQRKKIRTWYLVLTTAILIKTIYFSFSMIPYSNSIYYILTEHKPYSEREDYNFKYYKERTGKTFELRE